jgi:hypothetical protein
MPKPPEKPRFTVVSDVGTGLEAPSGLGTAGTAFWRRVQAEYGISDVGGVELLTQICGAIDTIELITQAIAADGVAVRARGGVVKAHPLLQSQIQNRAFVARSLERLGISVQEIKPVGPPTKPTGWIPGER